MVNVHITSQGALIALALIHLKSNNRAVADSLLMPQTFYSLEAVRPSFLLLKVLCKNLIMWDSIEYSRQWIEDQVPLIIRDIYQSDTASVEARYQQKLTDDGIDYSTVALCYVNIIAGAIFSIGFKYAGTGNKEAF
jgi:anaphase-promoting complex subunit 1